MIRLHRFLTEIKFNNKSYSFAANVSKTKPPAIQKLKEYPATQIDDAIKKTPELQKFTKDQWEKTFETLIEQGFRTSNFMKIIGKRPQLLRRPPNKLVESIECLRETQFGDDSIIELIEQHPELLEYTNIHDLRKRLAYLKPYAQSQKNIFRLFLYSPNVITDPEDAIRKKIDYLTRTMRVDETEATKSKVFSHSLDVIKCRHVFLSRLGLFKPKNPKVDPLQPSKNPKMNEIFDTSDREFAVKTCGVTLEEFETFRELYKREKNRYEDEDLEDE